ncbi:MAG: hypothetical protein ACD_62C00658G0005 [uncultured bacterium]|nr:MAG: hypothetical protein ACD_62C00658G0005 [uncultured bacterium]
MTILFSPRQAASDRENGLCVNVFGNNRMLLYCHKSTKCVNMVIHALCVDKLMYHSETCTHHGALYHACY